MVYAHTFLIFEILDRFHSSVPALRYSRVFVIPRLFTFDIFLSGVSVYHLLHPSVNHPLIFSFDLVIFSLSPSVLVKTHPCVCIFPFTVFHVVCHCSPFATCVFRVGHPLVVCP